MSFLSYRCFQIRFISFSDIQLSLFKWLLRNFNLKLHSLQLFMCYLQLNYESRLPYMSCRFKKRILSNSAKWWCLSLYLRLHRWSFQSCQLYASNLSIALLLEWYFTTLRNLLYYLFELLKCTHWMSFMPYRCLQIRFISFPNIQLSLLKWLLRNLNLKLHSLWLYLCHMQLNNELRLPLLPIWF